MPYARRAVLAQVLELLLAGGGAPPRASSAQEDAEGSEGKPRRGEYEYYDQYYSD